MPSVRLLTQELMVEAIQTLIAGIETGHLTTGQWVTWAEGALLKARIVDPWLVDLYEAVTPEAALVALYSGLRRSGQSEEAVDQTSLSLGFLYMRYRSGEFSLAALLRWAGELADRHNYGGPS